MNNNFRYDDYRFSDMEMLNQNQILPMQNDSTNQTANLAEPYQAFVQGNLFNNLYQGYKNYRPAQIVPNNEQAELLLNVDQLCFAAHELNLYLDNYPNDQRMIQLFNKYQSMANMATQEYEKKYGPLSVTFLSEPNQFSWEAYSWPWEVE